MLYLIAKIQFEYSIFMEQIKTEFTSRLRDAVRQCYELGYHPTRFEQMLDTLGGVNLAKKLVLSGDLQDGLKTLAKLGRLDLSMEAMMQEDKFRLLFTKSELEAATWRLAQMK